MERLASGYGLIEGPRADADGGLYFSDVTNGGVYRRAADGQVDTVVPKRRGVGGIALHAQGGIVCSGRNICHVRDGETRILFERPDIPGFNDIFTDARGRVFAGSMRTSPFGEQRGPRTPGELYRIGPDGEVVELYGDISLTNGIGLSPEGRRIYHSDSAHRHIVCHDLDDAGRAHNRRVFAELERGAPDGLAVDADGCVWTASAGGHCVARFAPDGTLDRYLEVPAEMVTSLCFGGSDGRDLYIVTADNTDDPTLGGCIFRTRAPVPGLPAAPARI